MIPERFQIAILSIQQVYPAAYQAIQDSLKITEKMEPTFVPGDTVTLKGYDAPIMIVEKVAAEIVSCTWFDFNDNRSAPFAKTSLQKVVENADKTGNL